MLFHLGFAKNSILSCFPAVITDIFNPTAELVIPSGIPTKRAKSEMETHPVTVEIKISKCAI